jgi:hypothetical protein
MSDHASAYQGNSRTSKANVARRYIEHHVTVFDSCTYNYRSFLFSNPIFSLPGAGAASSRNATTTYPTRTTFAATTAHMAE